MHATLSARCEQFLDLVAIATIVVSLWPFFTGRESWGAGGWLTFVLLGVGVALVALRRQAPLPAAAGSVATSALILLAPTDSLPVWVLAEICLFSLALRRSHTEAVVVGTLHGSLLYVGSMVALGVGPLDPISLILPVWTGAVVALGTALRNQQDYVRAVEGRAHTAAAAKESEVLRRVGEERLRIARDLHDSVANSLAIINLQAANAQRHLSDDPDRAYEALATVRAVGRTTLFELSEILTVLREDESDVDRTVATAENIPHLIELFRAAGMKVDADLGTLNPRDLDTARDAALYRIVQECLTNAQRHGTGSIRIQLTRRPRTVCVKATNDIPLPRSQSEPGFGLVGMRERTELAGGTLSVVDDGSVFTVLAELPRLGHEEREPESTGGEDAELEAGAEQVRMRAAQAEGDGAREARATGD